MPAVRHFLAAAAAVCALAAPSLSSAQTGGPDASGYIFGPSVYDFQVLATNANATALALGDDQIAPVTLPWAFPYYSNTYTTAYVDSNGKIQFNPAATTDWTNDCMGGTAGTPPDIAPLWDDLSPNLGGDVYHWYDAVNLRQIISWEDVPHFGNSDPVSFQVHLYESGLIEIHWADTDFQDASLDNGASATVGIQDAVGSTQTAGNALEWSCNTPSIVDGTATAFDICVDADADGAPDIACGGTDCDDTDAAVNPSAAEVCGDGIDNDCSGSDGDVDVDGDGGISTSCSGDDCDDTDATVYFGAPELCDQLDNDCDGVVPADESSDLDADGTVTCDDCDDNDALVFPGAAETCDGIDTNCDGQLFIGASPDVAPAATSSGTGGNRYRGNRYLVSTASYLDHVGWELDTPVGTTITFAVYEGASATGPWTNVGQSTLLTTQTGQVVHESPTMGIPLNAGSYYAILAHWDLASNWYGWVSGSGLVPVAHSFGTLEGGAAGTTLGTSVGTSTNLYPITVYTGQSEEDLDGDTVFPCQGDCDDTNVNSFPGATEICDGDDNDCDNVVPVNEIDGDLDGDLPCQTDCDDTNADVYGGAPEICDTLDNDCDGTVPQDEITDADADASVECADCDDTDSTAFPGATEICDGVDQNCDGLLTTIDEAPTPTINSSSSSLLRGLKVEVTTATALDSFQAFLDATPGETLNWLIYESTTENGTYTLVDSDTSTTTLPLGAPDWHSSPNFNFQMQAGMFYVLAVAWDATTASIEYYYATGGGFPVAWSFGNYVGSATGSGNFPASGNFNTSTTAYTLRALTGSESDLDADTYFACLDDCDDSDAAVNPGATEVCDGADNDCDGVLFTGEDDADGDGGLACADDCDDTNADIYTGAPELCDGLDNDCDTVVPADETTDADADTYVECDDCDDNDATFNPGATELCDGLDQNCDGLLFIGGGAPDSPPAATSSASGGSRYRGNRYLVSTTTTLDHLGWELDTPVGTTITYAVWEGTSLTGPWTQVATSTLVTTQTGQVIHESPTMSVTLTAGNYYAMAAHWDLTASWYGWTGSGSAPFPQSFGTLEAGVLGTTLSATTVGTSSNLYPMTVYTGVPEADNDGDSFFACATDCDDNDANTFPGATELCDGLDNDCDTVVPTNESDVDGDTYLECVDDCDDLNGLTYPGATEVCDAEDNDCDGVLPVNESTDADGDGSPACADCDDNDASQTPGGVEICDGVDSDCDGLLDGQDPDIGGTLVLSADLDSSDGAFVASAPTGSTVLWEYGVPQAGTNTTSPGPTTAAAGTNVWGTVLSGDYAATGNTTYLTLPPTAIPATGAPAFNFQYWQNNESDCQWDFGTVEIDDGTGFVLLDDGDACASGLADTNGAWVAVSIDLASYLGQTVTFRFGHTTDTIISNFPGLYVDEIYVGEIDDVDGDGWMVCGDCDDTDPNTNEGATEICDGLDNDCDSVVPANEADADGDGAFACADCDDTDPTIVPGAVELCDGIDQNCDGILIFGGSIDASPAATSSGTGGNRYRGNRYLVSTATTLDSIGWELDTPVGTVITYAVYEGASDTGPWTQLATNTLTTTQTGQVVHTSPGFGLPLQAGMYYALVAHWDLSASWYGWTGGSGVVPYAQSFGTLEGGAAGTTLDPTTVGTSSNLYPVTVNTGEPETDADADGFFVCANDCDDNDATVNPGAAEVCGNSIDEDCDGFAGTGADNDGDGVDDCSGDCNDNEVTVYTGAPELCDGLDNDCDGFPMADEIDADGDGSLACDDCDDTDATLFPGQVESCNGIDDDCDGVIPADELDVDGDGLTGCDGDCVDTDPNIPAATESCDGLDTDCDGVIPAGEADNDGDGSPICEPDCDDNDPNNFPGNPEVCDGFDNDCSGAADFAGELDDVDMDGSPACIDCDDTDALNFPGNPEVCDGQDNDCDAGTDETVDFDGDTFTVCDDDCDDAEAAAYPGADEICDGGIDNDCDPATDEDGDVDGDGETICDGDCDDDNADTNTTASEICDGEDNDCDGAIPADETEDVDGDGSPVCEDCDDADPDTYPGAPELCDGLDNDCDGAPETGGGEDLDGDGQGTCDGDCDDNNADVYLGAPELCDGLDNDCDLEVPADEIDADADMFLGCDDDCDDADPFVNPDALEADACDDGVDNDCDGDIDADDADCAETGDDDDSAGDDDDATGDDDDSGAAGDDDDAGCDCNNSVAASDAAPGSLALLALGLGLGLVRRRRD